MHWVLLVLYLFPGLFAARKTIALYEGWALRKYDQIVMDGADWTSAVVCALVSMVAWPIALALMVLSRPAKWFFTPPVQKSYEKHTVKLNTAQADAKQMAGWISTARQLGADPRPLEQLLAAKVEDVFDLAGADWEQGETFKRDMRRTIG